MVAVCVEARCPPKPPLVTRPEVPQSPAAPKAGLTGLCQDFLRPPSRISTKSFAPLGPEVGHMCDPI